MARRKKLQELRLEWLPGMYEEVREQAQQNIASHPPPPALDVEIKRLWIEELKADHGIPEEEALALLKAVPKVTELKELAKAL